jgi:hypothetical protein
MANKEATARIKINKLLKAAGWLNISMQVRDVRKSTQPRTLVWSIQGCGSLLIHENKRRK